MEYNKYIITLWEDHFDYDGLYNKFSILDVCYDLEDATRRIKLYSDKVIIDGILQKKIESEQNKEFVEMEIPDYKKEDSFATMFFPPNIHNKVISRISRAICASDYDKFYYYLELVELLRDTKIKPELFNLDKCKFEVERFFEDGDKE